MHVKHLPDRHDGTISKQGVIYESWKVKKIPLCVKAECKDVNWDAKKTASIYLMKKKIGRNRAIQKLKIHLSPTKKDLKHLYW